MKKVLDTYTEKHDGAPKELFIHGQTSFREDEWRAFDEAAPKGTNVVGVRIKRTSGETKLSGMATIRCFAAPRLFLAIKTPTLDEGIFAAARHLYWA